MWLPLPEVIENLSNPQSVSGMMESCLTMTSAPLHPSHLLPWTHTCLTGSEVPKPIPSTPEGPGNISPSLLGYISCSWDWGSWRVIPSEHPTLVLFHRGWWSGKLRALWPRCSPRVIFLPALKQSGAAQIHPLQHWMWQWPDWIKNYH